MARITVFERLRSKNLRPHPTETECGYAVFDYAGERYLLLETYGSRARKIPGKVSQSVQLDREAASRLRELLDDAFPPHG